MTWVSWSFASAFFAGLTAILAKVGVSGIDSNLATAIRTLVVLVFTAGIAYGTRQPNGASALTGRTFAFLVFSGVATGASWLCYFRALQLGPASKVAPIDKLSVVFVLLLAALFLHERLSPPTILGAALIVTGALVLVISG